MSSWILTTSSFLLLVTCSTAEQSSPWHPRADCHDVTDNCSSASHHADRTFPVHPKTRCELMHTAVVAHTCTTQCNIRELADAAGCLKSARPAAPGRTPQSLTRLKHHRHTCASSDACYTHASGLQCNLQCSGVKALSSARHSSCWPNSHMLCFAGSCNPSSRGAA